MKSTSLDFKAYSNWNELSEWGLRAAFYSKFSPIKGNESKLKHSELSCYLTECILHCLTMCSIICMPITCGQNCWTASKDLLTGHQSGCGPQTNCEYTCYIFFSKVVKFIYLCCNKLPNYKIQLISGHVSLLSFSEVADSLVRRQLYFVRIFNQSLETFILFLQS